MKGFPMETPNVLQCQLPFSSYLFVLLRSAIAKDYYEK